MFSFVIIALVSVLALVLVLYRNHGLSRELKNKDRQYAQLEGRLQQFFEDSPEAIFLLEKDGNIVDANNRACESLKMPRKDLLKKSIVDVSPYALQQEVSSRLQHWFSGERVSCEGTLMGADHRIIPVEMHGRLDTTADRKVLELHVLDTTFRKNAEDKIHASLQLNEESREIAGRALDMAEQASKAKSEFLASMSRDIRIPLNDIIGMGTLLEDSENAVEREECITVIQQASVGLLKIVNNVLNIAEIESGQMDIQIESFDVRELCQNLYERFRDLAESDGIQLMCECDQTVPQYLQGDVRLIEQVLDSLLANALKYTHYGLVSLQIECPSKSPSGAGLHFQVTDTGIGLSTEKQATIFDSFIPAKASAKRHYGDTGLGLAICKRQVELMGGLMGVNSFDGQGSTFFFNLSLQESDALSASTASLAKKEKTVHCEGIRVLLAEDNPVNQKVASAMLRKVGCKVDAVENGRDAMLQIRKADYDVVLMDCEMPVMDGFESTGKIRAMRAPYCKVPIIALTANAMKDDHKKCIDGGMNDYISKPISREKLIALINKHTQTA